MEVMRMVRNSKVKIGFIPANRGFFSDVLAAKMRAQTVKALKDAGAEVVVPTPKETKVGTVANFAEAVTVGKIFRDRRVDGILISAVNFGDEASVALTIKESGLNVPVLIVGCQEEQVLAPGVERRDSFCGLLSIGEVLRQIGVAYSVPEVPICFPTDESFKGTLERFLGVCRVVNGIRNARYGQVGARPNDFWTCRFNEKALQQLGVTTVTLDLSEVIGDISRMGNTPAVRRIMTDYAKSMDCSALNDDMLRKIAKFEVVMNKFVEDQRLDGLAVQCWTSIQQNLGMCSCSTMSRFDDRGIPSACESDIMGTLSMHALQLASGSPSCLADWNNLHNEDSELANLWHCGVFPLSWAKGNAKLACHEICAGTVGRENAMGTIEFVMQDGPVTLCRATHDNNGAFKVVLAHGAVEPNVATTFGAYGWVRIPGLQRLYRNVLLRHFPHHVAMSRSTVGNVLWEAFGNYLGFQTYTAANTAGCWNPDLPFESD
jgi:L-fucose isomerase-like protein